MYYEYPRGIFRSISRACFSLPDHSLHAAPVVPNNISKYNYKDRMYKVDPPGPGDHLAMHLAIDGWALFREGDEAKLQATAEEKKKAAADEARKETQKQVTDKWERGDDRKTQWVLEL